MKVKYDEYIIKCSYKELSLIRTSLRTLEHDYKTHRFSNYKEHSEVGKLIKHNENKHASWMIWKRYEFEKVFLKYTQDISWYPVWVPS